jgi:hypothetical protein
MKDEPFQACPGAPILPGGSCDYCGQAIRYIYRFRGSDGKTFKVGCEARAVRHAKSEFERPKREAKAKAKREKEDAKKVAVMDFALSSLKSQSVRDRLAALPHPHPGLASSGKTWLDWAEYLTNVLKAPAQVSAFIQAVAL